jgi:hypothetical protein
MIQLLFLGFLFAQQASTQVILKQCDEKKPANCAQFISKGTAAPFDGQILTTSLAIDLSLKADKCDAVIQLETSYEQKKAEASINLEKTLRQNDLQQHKLEIDVMNRELIKWEKAAHIPFYEKPWFVCILTSAVVGSLVIGTVQLTK